MDTDSPKEKRGAVTCAGQPPSSAPSKGPEDNTAGLGRFAALALYLAETGSTMDDARVLAKGGAPHMSLVIAQRQTKGRGRLARSWESGDGGLYFTLITRPELKTSSAHLVLFTASSALCKVLRDKYGVNASVKWPNDLLAGGKKISGMLSELSAEGDEISHLNLGIGVNVNNDPASAFPESTSLRILTGKKFDVMEVLKNFLSEFEQDLARINDGGVMARWKALSQTLGRRVNIVTTQRTFSGEALDVDEDGALILRLADGSIERVIHGDCFHSDLTP